MYLFSPLWRKKPLAATAIAPPDALITHNPSLIPSRINSQLSPLPAFRLSIQFLKNRTWRFYAPECIFIRFDLILPHLISSHLFHSTPSPPPPPPHPLPSHPLPSPNFLPTARFPPQTRSQTPYLGDFFSLGSVRPLVTISGERRCCCCWW